MQKLLVFIGGAREGDESLHLSPRPGSANWPRWVCGAVGGGPLECAAAGGLFSDKTGGRGSWKRSIYLFLRSNGGGAAVNSDSEGGVHLASIWVVPIKTRGLYPTLHHSPQPRDPYILR